MSPLLIGVLAYVLVQLGIGVVVSRRVKTEEDYLVAGRRLGPVLVTVSIFATWFGAGTCVSAAGQVYEGGLSRESVEPFAYGICLLVAGVVFVGPLWRRRITTLGDLFRQRFSPGVERLGAIVLIPPSALWAGAQVRAFGQVLSSASDLEVETAIAIAAAITVAYTVMGGLLADVVTDVLQGGVLVLGLVVLLVAVSGDAEAAAAPMAPNGSAAAALPSLWETVDMWAIAICGSVVAQEVLARSFASRSEAVARGGMLAGGGIYLVIGLLPVVIGLLGTRLMPGLEESEQILPALAQRYLSTFGYVVFAGALVSAILSTVDSALLAAASITARNLVGGSTDRGQLITARLCVVGYGVCAWVLAHVFDNVGDLVEQASGFGSAGIVVAVSFGLFTRLGGPRSATFAIVAGMVAWVVGAYCVEGYGYKYLTSLAAALLGYLVGASSAGTSCHRKPHDVPTGAPLRPEGDQADW